MFVDSMGRQTPVPTIYEEKAPIENSDSIPSSGGLPCYSASSTPVARYNSTPMNVSDEELDDLERKHWHSTGVVNEGLQVEEFFNYRDFARDVLALYGNTQKYSLKEISDWIVECTEDLKNNMWAARVSHPDSMSIVAAALHDLIYSRYTEVPPEIDDQNKDTSSITKGEYDPKCCISPKSCRCGDQ
jgi:hypothetical protein